MSTIEVPTAVPLVDIPGIELAALGQWDASTGTTTFTLEDFENAVEAMDCPGVRNPVLKLGHDEEDSTNGIRWDGEPAIGWVDNMRLNAGRTKILGDWRGMPSWLAEVLPTAYPDRSIEMWRPFICQIGHRHPAVITAVALLGVQRPGVGTIRSLQDVKALFTTAGSMAPQVSKLTAVKVGDRLVLAQAQSPLRRQLTKVEEAAKTDFQTVQWTWASTLDRLMANWTPIRSAWESEIVQQVEQLTRDDDLTGLARMKVDQTVARDLLREVMGTMYTDAEAEMMGEATRQGVHLAARAASLGDEDVPAEDASLLKRIASTVVSLMAAGMAMVAARRAVQASTPANKPEDVAGIVGGYLADASPTATRDQLGVALSAAQNAGRISVMKRAPKAAYYASEVLDASTCKNCSQVDGRRFADLQEVQASYTNGGYVDCLGHLRCRGTVVALWDEMATAASTRTVHIPISLSIEGARGADHRSFRLR